MLAALEQSNFEAQKRKKVLDKRDFSAIIDKVAGDSRRLYAITGQILPRLHELMMFLRPHVFSA